MEIFVASSNRGKLAEYQAVIDQYDLDLSLTSVLDLAASPAVHESGATYLENARIKALAYRDLVTLPILGDDGGLEIRALPELFGLRTQRTFPPGLTDPEKNAYILDLLEGATDRSASLHASLLLLLPDGQELVSQVSLEFEIARQPRGRGGHGFDPILEVKDLGLTTGQLTDADRQAYSARRLAFEQLTKELKNV